MKQKQIGCLLTVGIILVSSMSVSNSACGKEQGESLKWSMETNKNEFYPGEPVLLTLNISNVGMQEEKVNFGMDGIEAFSMEIRDSNNRILKKGSKIQRWGNSRIGTLLVNTGKTSKKSIVLNQWCSTLLSPGKYQLICDIDYRLRSESKKIEDSDGFKAGPIHTLQMKLDIHIIAMDAEKFKQILDSLAEIEVKPEGQSNKEWWENLKIAREMLAFTESETAVPYQLQLLRVEKTTWLKRDIINSIVKSGTLEAANGLMQIIEDCPQCGIEDIKLQVINAVYRLRETGNLDIIKATEQFVTKYKRPILAKPVD